MTASFFLFITGFIVVGFGVGGVEQSITNTELAQAAIVATVGLLIMWCGQLMITQEHARG